MTKKELFKRYVVCIIGLFFSGIGIAFTKHGELGVTPISSVANVMSFKIPDLSLGQWLIIWNCVLILVQILILRKDFQIVQLLQVPISFLFGWFTDIGMWMVSSIPVPNYPSRLLMLAIGIVILAFGIALSVIADVVLNSGEAVVKAVSQKSGLIFGNVKVGFDVSCVVLAVILSVIFFGGSIVGTREGTVISAVCTGFVVRFFTGKIRNTVEGFLMEEPEII